MIRFNKATSLKKIEEMYALLGAKTSNELSLPNGFSSEGGFGIYPAVIQFLAAWSRVHSDSTLVVSGSPSSADVKNLVLEPYGAAAIYFASQVKFHDGTVVLRDEARRFLLPSVKAMQSWDLRKTMGPRGVHLVSYGQALNEYVLPFYSLRTADSLRDEHGFVNMMSRAIKAFYPTFLNRISEAEILHLGMVCYELFCNTHEHARTDERGAQYKCNVRGFIARLVEYRQSDPETGTLATDQPLQSYFARMSSSLPILPVAVRCKGQSAAH